MNFVPLDKQSEKEQRKYHPQRIMIDSLRVVCGVCNRLLFAGRFIISY